MISAVLEANKISAAFPYKKERRRVLDRDMAYVEVGDGDPIVLTPPRRTFGATCCRTSSDEAAASPQT